MWNGAGNALSACGIKGILNFVRWGHALGQEGLEGAQTHWDTWLGAGKGALKKGLQEQQPHLQCPAGEMALCEGMLASCCPPELPR